MFRLKQILSVKELERLSESEREKYFSELKQYCINIKPCNKKSNIVRSIVNSVVGFMRNYDFEVVGVENIPSDEKALFVANHSNAHDFLTMQEAFKKIGLNQTFLASNEGLSPIILSVFKACGGVLFNRSDKSSATNAFWDFASNIANGIPGVIYAESTWNLHPYKPMHLIKNGAVNIAAITEVPIIPTIYEYVEVPEWCTKESKIYSKCIVKFGQPIYISKGESIIKQTDYVQLMLEKNRLDLWKKLGMMKTSVEDIDKEVYLNHTYLKKFGGVGGYGYDTDRETKYLFVKDSLSAENEYHIDENGNFVPGTLTREEGKKYIKKR